MATKSVTTTKNGYTLTLTATEQSYSATENTSQVYLALTLKANGTRFEEYLCSGHITANGAVVASFSQYYSIAGLYETVTLVAVSKRFAHAADGSLVLDLNGVFDGPAGGSYTPGSGRVSLSFTGTTLPRASAVVSLLGTPESGFTVGVVDYLSSPKKSLRLVVGHTTVATRENFTSGRVVLTGKELLSCYQVAGRALSTTVAAVLETQGVGQSVKTLAVSLRGNLRQRRDGGWEQGRLYVYHNGWRPAVIHAYKNGWRRGQ